MHRTAAILVLLIGACVTPRPFVKIEARESSDIVTVAPDGLGGAWVTMRKTTANVAMYTRHDVGDTPRRTEQVFGVRRKDFLWLCYREQGIDRPQCYVAQWRMGSRKAPAPPPATP